MFELLALPGWSWWSTLSAVTVSLPIVVGVAMALHEP